MAAKRVPFGQQSKLFSIGGLIPTLVVLVRSRQTARSGVTTSSRRRCLEPTKGDLFRGEDSGLPRQFQPIPDLHQRLGEPIDQRIVMVRRGRDP